MKPWHRLTALVAIVASPAFGQSLLSSSTPFGTQPSSVAPILPAAAGRSPGFFLMLDSSIGSSAGLGYKLPDTTFGFSIEKAVGQKFEVQVSAAYSPTHKYITNDGESLLAGASGLYWVNWRFAVLGGAKFSQLWTSQFEKVAFYPVAGLVFRTMWMHENAGRIYVTYEFPTGCVWATASNPCVIQSSRLTGVNFNPEFRVFSHTRAGLEMGIWHFCDQGNPQDPAAGRSCHVTGTTAIKFRFEIGRKEDTGHYY